MGTVYLSAPPPPGARTPEPLCHDRDVLEDGTYDAVVVDATTHGDALSLDLTILAGSHKGEVVRVRAVGFDLDEIDALGLPGTLVVENGVPRFAVER
jgi:hypothetical protein